MDYKKRQGRVKLKLSIQEVRKMEIYKEIEQPEMVYHMTDKDNLTDIISNGKIKSFNDFMTYFFQILNLSHCIFNYLMHYKAEGITERMGR